MSVVLIGSVSSSEAALKALIAANVDVRGVLGLDAAAGKNVSDFRDLEPIAVAAGIAYQSFRKITESGVEQFLQTRQPDFLWVIGLSQLIPQSLRSIARQGAVGFHPTMLPRGRGRAPVAWTILLGEPAAVTLFHLTDEPDAGDIIAQREVPVLPDDYSEALIARTNQVLAEVIRDLSPCIHEGKLPRRGQDHRLATYYAKRTPADGLIVWEWSTDRIYRLIRAAGRPYPGAFSYAHGRCVTIWRAQLVDFPEPGFSSMDGLPGTILDGDRRQGVIVRTGDGTLRLTEVSGPGTAELHAGMVLTHEVNMGSGVDE